MGSYILYGKDENGYNAVQRGEITDGNKRYNSFKKKDDKLLSLEEILDNPIADQQALKPANAKQVYTVKKPEIKKPKYDRHGNLLDPGDSDIPGMTELWERIKVFEHIVAVNEGKVETTENDTLLDNGYRLYQLKHWLIDLRRHQYYLRDSYKPTLHFQQIDHPRPAFYDWTCDSFYWMPLEKWRERVDNALLHSISKKIEDYETRQRPDGTLEVKWVVRKHTFDWENPLHIKALLNNYDALYDQVKEKLDTYGRTLIFDFERYCDLADFSDARKYIIKKKIEKMPYTEILKNLQIKFGLTYNDNHLSTIIAKEIPQKIATLAKKMRLLIETPESEMKKCYTCGRLLPRDPLFFVRNRSRKDNFSSNCKECEKKQRIARGGQTENDRRNKETQMFKM